MEQISKCLGGVNDPELFLCLIAGSGARVKTWPHLTDFICLFLSLRVVNHHKFICFPLHGAGLFKEKGACLQGNVAKATFRAAPLSRRVNCLCNVSTYRCQTIHGRFFNGCFPSPKQRRRSCPPKRIPVAPNGARAAILKIIEYKIVFISG